MNTNRRNNCSFNYLICFVIILSIFTKSYYEIFVEGKQIQRFCCCNIENSINLKQQFIFENLAKNFENKTRLDDITFCVPSIEDTNKSNINEVKIEYSKINHNELLNIKEEYIKYIPEYIQTNKLISNITDYYKIKDERSIDLLKYKKMIDKMNDICFRIKLYQGLDTFFNMANPNKFIQDKCQSFTMLF